MPKTSEFDFHLPPELIAQAPFFPKEQTSMLVFDGMKMLDRRVIDLVNFLQAGDVLVFNDAKVIKAKLSAKIIRNSAKIEFNLDQEIVDGVWRALCRPAKKIKGGDVLEIATDFHAIVQKKYDDGFIEVVFDSNDLLAKLDKYGAVPLPPYIKRDQQISQNQNDQQNYQTIYAREPKAVAAPTAGLHFTKEIFAMLLAKKIHHVFVTLNVGAGTFLPVRADEIKDHKMHEESFFISADSANIINAAKARGGRVVAVGTTSLRVLESACDNAGMLCETEAKTNIFIYPSYQFKIVDILMTNFHLPKSTLFMLVAAFVGRKKACEIYSHAISRRYRFYSSGDVSLLFRG
jgi:S-adenosylmethionine:tRNA ribosyltransferase-isomerase